MVSPTAGSSPAAADSPAPRKEFSIRRVNLRRMGFDAPLVPNVAAHNIDWENIELHTQRESRRLDENRYELVFTLYVHMKDDNGTVLQVTVEEVGIFRVLGYPEEEALALLRTKGAEQVYPYAREAVLSLVGRADIPNLGLKPLSFDLPD